MPVAKELIDQLLSAGRMAPSAMNKQPWKFYILANKEKTALLSKEIGHIALQQIGHINLKEMVKMTLSFFHFSKIMDFVKTQDHIFYDAPVVIFITSPRNDEWGTLGVGMCAQNIMLAAKAVGLDTCPVGFAKFVMQAENYYLLDIPATEQVELAIIIGYGNEQPKTHEREENNAIYI